jgi:hypothetical protein
MSPDHKAALYARYKQFYGYVFYIGKKISMEEFDIWKRDGAKT